VWHHVWHGVWHGTGGPLVDETLQEWMRRDITGMHFSVGDDIICVSFLQIVRTIGQLASGGRSWPTVRHLLCSTLHCNFLYAPPYKTQRCGYSTTLQWCCKSDDCQVRHHSMTDDSQERREWTAAKSPLHGTTSSLAHSETIAHLFLILQPNPAEVPKMLAAGG